MAAFLNPPANPHSGTANCPPFGTALGAKRAPVRHGPLFEILMSFKDDL